MRREKYVGSWLPEPLLTEKGPEADDCSLYESLPMAFLVLLESLSPVERAAFILKEVLGYDYPENSCIVDKTEANCRQIARRAKIGCGPWTAVRELTGAGRTPRQGFSSQPRRVGTWRTS